MRRGIAMIAAASLAHAALGQLCDPPFTARYIGRSLTTPTVPVADFDGDGDADVVTPEYDLQLQLFENLGGDPPAFDEHSLQGGPCQNWFGYWGAHGADIDGDGRLDILCAPNFVEGDLVWYQNLGGVPPAFCEHPVGEIGYAEGWGPHAADLDGDGDLDLIGSVARQGMDGAIAWYENRGGSPPLFTDHVLAVANSVMSVWGTDLDGDGDADVLGAALDSLRWYENDGGSPPSFVGHSLPVDPPGTPRLVTAGDLDADGDADVVFTSNDAERRWLENVGGAPTQFVARSYGEGTNKVYSVRPVDLDRDGLTDVVCGEEGAAALYLNQGGSPPEFQRCVLATTPGCIAAEPGDIDLDGATDVVVRFGPEVYWLENQRCVADFNEDAVVDTRDCLAFLNAWNADSPGADINWDGAFNTLDVLAFLNLWVEGCG